MKKADYGADTDFEARHYSRPPHVGDAIRDLFLDEENFAFTQGQVADRLGISRQNFNAILNGKRAVTPLMAMRLSRVLGLHPQTWLNIQQGVDIYDALHGPASKQIAKLKRLGFRKSKPIGATARTRTTKRAKAA